MPHRPSREVEAIVAGRHDDPFAFLGMHKASAGIYVRAMLPDAEEMAVIDTATGDVAARGERIHPAGFFVASMPDRKAPFRYRLRVSWGGHSHEFDDVYRFPPVLGELDIHLLVEGNHLASYQKLGAHAVVHDGVEGVAFAVWAPNARRVSLVGDFNAWDGRRMPMRKRHAGGFWEIFVPGLRPGHLYKYELLGAHGELLPLKADPHAERAERAAGHRLGRRWAVAPSLAGQRLDERALGTQRPRGADLDLRGASRLVAAQPGWARTLSQLSRTGRAAGALRRRSRLHPYRGDADDGIPVRRLVGLSADLAVRADLAPWRSRRLPRLYRFLPPTPGSACGSIGCRGISQRTLMGSAGSTAPRSTSMPIRGKGCTATGTR